MENYDYRQAMKDDIRDYLSETDLTQYDSRDELEEALNNDLWIADSVTGNASGSYTFSRYKAKEYVTDNTDLLAEMLEEFCVDAETIADKLKSDNWEWFDVSIRCYLLGQMIAETLDEMENENALPYGKGV